VRTQGDGDVIPEFWSITQVFDAGLAGVRACEANDIWLMLLFAFQREPPVQRALYGIRSMNPSCRIIFAPGQ
jgi:hypothetical protein